jgi:uncharacterized membrane protein YhaH (DUF805 family)
MKGRVLGYDAASGTGQISGDDGQRYNFTRADLKPGGGVVAGTEVDFDTVGRHAKDIYVLSVAPWQAAYTGPVGPELSFFGYFKRAMTTDYFNFSGRARRKEYWGFWVFPLVFYAIIGAVALLSFAGRDVANEGPSALFIVALIALGVFALGMIIPGLAVQVRRLHDIGQSGWVLLLMIVLSLAPGINVLVTIGYVVLGCLDPQPGANKYGPPAK